MRSEVGVAVVGIGFMGTAHARAARLAGGRVVGVAASTPERAKDAAARLGADRGFVSADALVTDTDVDVVHLCVPNHLHLPLATAALEAGKHVVCEKPLALDLDGARALRSTWQAAGTIGTVPFVYRFHPMVRELRARLATLGRVHLVHGVYLQDWLSREDAFDWRCDPARGGPSRAFADIGSHWFDLVEFVTGDRVAALSAVFGKAYAGRPTEDHALVVFETAGGARGSAVISQVSPGHKNSLTIEVSGTESTARFEQEAPGSLWIGKRNAATVVAADPAVLAPDAARHVVAPAGHPQGYLDCIDRFVADTYAAIHGASPEGLPTIDDGWRAAVITEAALESARSGGRWIEVTS